MRVTHTLISLIMRSVYHRGTLSFIVILSTSFFVFSGYIFYASLTTNSKPSQKLIWNAENILLDQSHKMKVSFLDIGQGDSILIQAPNGNSMLIDSGPVGGKVLSKISHQKSFFDTYVDVILVTHGDADHVGSMFDVIKKYSGGLFLYSGVEAPTKIYKSLIKYIQGLSNGNIKNLIIMDGMKIILDQENGVYFEILFPNFLYELYKYENCASKIAQDFSITKKSRSNQKYKDAKKIKQKKSTFTSCKKFLKLETNENSIVGKLTYGSTTFISTGDAPIDIEKFLIEESKKTRIKFNTKKDSNSNNINNLNSSDSPKKDFVELDSDVLKLGHHGSRTSTSDEFLKIVSPDYVVISSGKDNRYKHPHTETLERLKKYNDSFQDESPFGSTHSPLDILRTDTSGTITFISDGSHISVETEK